MDRRTMALFGLLLVIYIIGFNIDVMDIDAAQYASMSREMMESGNYLQVYDQGIDYLDKPPFLFWISAVSMKIFGVNNFAYRIPSFLFALLALFATFKLTRLFYNKKTALLAALILASCQGFFLMNHDVRTDTILMGWVIFSVWQLAAWYQSGKLFHFLLGCIGIAGGMMTKGPIALMVPVFAFGAHFILQKNWKVFFRWQYLLGICVIAFFLLPMCLGLYRQFDLQPEKLVNGKTGVSGLRFFFWTQSFGRITGESSWNNNSNIFFLLQNMLWSFLPWIIFFLIALYLNIKQIITQRFSITINQEAITTGGFMITYLSLGLSKYQLPHYIFVAFPFAAIITARFIYDLIYDKKYPKLYSMLLKSHMVIFILLWIALMALLSLCFDTIPVYMVILAAIMLAGLMVIYFTKRDSPAFFIIISLYSMAGINFFLNSSFYPSLLKYQAGSVAGKWINENNIPVSNIYTYQYPIWRSLSFYANGMIRQKDSTTLIQPGDYILTRENYLDTLSGKGLSFEVIHKGFDYPVSRLSLKFLNQKTREKHLTVYTLIRIKKNP